MVITVAGLGFVGLTTALGLAAKGHMVYGTEPDEARRETIRNNQLPFFEPYMKEQLEALQGNHFFVEEHQEHAAKSDAVFYCVGTPFSPDGSADLTYLFAALSETLEAVRGKNRPVLIVKSTVPPGTMKNRVVPFVKDRGFEPGRDLDLANNPEFLREGKCWEDFTRADRIVAGTDSERAFTVIRGIYRDFDAPVHRVTPTTGEFIKYLSNTMLATMISYANEMAETAWIIGDIEIGRAFHILHEDQRWASGTMADYVYPGCGYGGYCLPKDTQAMLYAGTAAGAEMPVLKAVIDTNRTLTEKICGRITKDLPEDAVIGILGLAFKPETDDVRDSSAARIIAKLQEAGRYRICAADPLAAEEFAAAYPQLDVEYLDSPEEVIGRSDRVFLATAWEQYRPFAKLDKVIDGRYMEG